MSLSIPIINNLVTDKINMLEQKLENQNEYYNGIILNLTKQINMLMDNHNDLKNAIDEKTNEINILKYHLEEKKITPSFDKEIPPPNLKRNPYVKKVKRNPYQNNIKDNINNWQTVKRKGGRSRY
jgi:hypothetical protein